MKAAEEWATDINGIKWLDNSHPTMTNVVKQIQLDAMKEGARRATKVICGKKSRGMIRAVTYAAENWTIKDL